MKVFRISIILYLFAASCEEKIDLPLSPENTGLLVVEGVLTNELKNHVVRLSRPYALQNGKREPVSGAAVFIFEDTVMSVLTEFPAGSGNYYTSRRRAVFGKTYTLLVRHEGKNYFAQDRAVPVEPLEDLQYRKTGDGYVLTFSSTGAEPYYIEHLVSWTNTSTCVAPAACEGSVMFYDLQTIDVNEIFKPEKEPFFFPPQSVVVRRKYSVSSQYKVFLRSMLSETEWRGGVFDVQRSSVPTNLSKGATGFFAVCSVVADTTVVN